MFARWPQEVDEAMRAHAARTFPDECCGALLVDQTGVVSARPLDNAAVDRRHGFLVSARDSLRVEAHAEALGLTVVGYYHSHPDGPATPSERDAAAAWPERWTVIIPVHAGIAGPPRAFRFEGGRFFPLDGTG